MTGRTPQSRSTAIWLKHGNDVIDPICQIIHHRILLCRLCRPRLRLQPSVVCTQQLCSSLQDLWLGGQLAARRDFQDALVQEFNFLYGINGKDLSAWQKLCQAIGIEPLPDTIKACRQRVWDAHVNIVDLIEAVRLDRPVRQFDTLGQLAAYTTKHKRFFPKDNAYQGGLLQELLREIINPYFGAKRSGSQKRKARRVRKQAAAST